jgi:hypothetical protein
MLLDNLCKAQKNLPGFERGANGRERMVWHASVLNWLLSISFKYISECGNIVIKLMLASPDKL